MSAPFDVEGLNVVVVGGTSGLGLSGARVLAQHGAGVLVVGKTQQGVESAVADIGGATLGLAGDAADPEVCDRAVAQAVAAWGRLDALYHVAGGSGRRKGDGPLHEVTDDGWTYTLDLNLRSVMHSNRAALRQFIAQGSGGAILNMSSVLGWSPSPKHFASHAYAAAKAAIVGLSKATASYYAPHDIRVNVIAPGLVETPMSQRAMGQDEIMQFVRAKQPLNGGRVGAPSDLDGAVLFLLSRQARFITGQVLAVDGGWTVSEGVK